MRHPALLFIGGGLFVGAVACAPQAGQPGEEGTPGVTDRHEQASDVGAALERIPEAWETRALAADWEGVAALYHADAVLMPMDAPAVKGRDAIQDTLARILGREGGVELDHLSVEVLEAEAAGDLVYVGAAYRTGGTMTVDGRAVPFEQQGSYVNILRRDDTGAWRIHRQIINRDHPLPTPEPDHPPPNE